MEGNIYQTPEADLELPIEEAAEFYVVSRKKFLVLYFFTLGFYQLYWFYKHWDTYRKSNGYRQSVRPSLWPVPRAIFAVFFTHSLFKLIFSSARKIDSNYKWHFQLTATMFVIFDILSNVIDRLTTNELLVSTITLLSVLVVGWALYSAQVVANFACNDSRGAGNSRLTVLNFVWIVLGLVLWLFIAVVIFEVVSGQSIIG